MPALSSTAAPLAAFPLGPGMFGEAALFAACCGLSAVCLALLAAAKWAISGRPKRAHLPAWAAAGVAVTALLWVGVRASTAALRADLETNATPNAFKKDWQATAGGRGLDALAEAAAAALPDPADRQFSEPEPVEEPVVVDEAVAAETDRLVDDWLAGDPDPDRG